MKKNLLELFVVVVVEKSEEKRIVLKKKIACKKYPKIFLIEMSRENKIK